MLWAFNFASLGCCLFTVKVDCDIVFTVVDGAGFSEILYVKHRVSVL